MREAGPDTLIVADGFSCKTQIADSGTGRHALHTGQVLKMAREHRSPDEAMAPPAPPLARRAVRTAVAAAPAVAAAGVITAAIARKVARG